MRTIHARQPANVCFANVNKVEQATQHYFSRKLKITLRISLPAAADITGNAKRRISKKSSSRRTLTTSILESTETQMSLPPPPPPPFLPKFEPAPHSFLFWTSHAGRKTKFWKKCCSFTPFLYLVYYTFYNNILSGCFIWIIFVRSGYGCMNACLHELCSLLLTPSPPWIAV